jgi:hypothetical protein
VEVADPTMGAFTYISSTLTLSQRQCRFTVAVGKSDDYFSSESQGEKEDMRSDHGSESEEKECGRPRTLLSHTRRTTTGGDSSSPEPVVHSRSAPRSSWIKPILPIPSSDLKQSLRESPSKKVQESASEGSLGDSLVNFDRDLQYLEALCAVKAKEIGLCWKTLCWVSVLFSVYSRAQTLVRFPTTEQRNEALRLLKELCRQVPQTHYTCANRYRKELQNSMIRLLQAGMET